MELEHTLRILGLVVGAAALLGRSLATSDAYRCAHGTKVGSQACKRSRDERACYSIAWAQVLASRLLTLLSRTFGERLLSLQFFSSALMLALSTVATVYLKTLADVGAGAALFFKYSVVLTAALTGLLVTRARGSWAGLLTFILFLLALSALSGTRTLTYSTLFMLALPGMLSAPLSLPATRWCLRRAQASGRAVVWLAGLSAAPAACGWALALAGSFVQPADPRLSGFFSVLGAASLLSFNALISAGLCVACLGFFVHRVARRVAFGGRREPPDLATIRRRMAGIALLSLGAALAPYAWHYLGLHGRGP